MPNSFCKTLIKSGKHFLSIAILIISLPIAHADTHLDAYNHAGSICKSNNVEPLLKDYSKWLDKPDSVPDMRLRFQTLITKGCHDGLLVLLYSKTQLNAGKIRRYHERCKTVLPVLEKSIEHLKNHYPKHLLEAYDILGYCSSVVTKPTSEIISWYKLALSRKPDSIDYQLTLAGLYGRDNQIDKSKALALKLLESDIPDNNKAYAYSILGGDEMLEKNPQKAVFYYKKANELNLKMRNVEDPYTLAKLAKAYDEFDHKQGQIYWNKLKQLKDDPYFQFKLDDETEKLLIERTKATVKEDTQTTSKTSLNWDLSYSTLFDKLGVDTYDNARQSFAKKKGIKLQGIDQNTLKSAVMIDYLAMQYFGYRVTYLYYQTKNGKTFQRKYEEKNSRREEMTIESNSYIQMLNTLRLMKQQKPSKKYDTFAGYSAVVTLFEMGKTRQILIPNELIAKVFSETQIIKEVKH